MSVVEIPLWNLATAYLLLLIPLALFLYLGAHRVRETLVSVVRMTVQLLFVGLYLHVVFELDHPGVTLLWLLVMVLVADASILRGCGLRIQVFAFPLFFAILLGTILPALFFTFLVLRLDAPFEAQYLIPIGGMILGNCLRADIIGLQHFSENLKKRESHYLLCLSQGASRTEALRPFFRDALQAALGPTLASMATIGLVSLPGMMTGVILAGADPGTAIRYQIAIMISIFSGTALTVFLAIHFSIPRGFSPAGIPHPTLSKSS
ncbi:MAG: ABC transporter permease [Verrucomicrobia bacterium]|nr:ABC transporter permease [Verrucomicrobiota bacterium]MCH8512521.1 ABC transporter permease [Kiritimatiellia bacterium]